jgi:pimeloyl-ACP methyl ester carboxylesterase
MTGIYKSAAGAAEIRARYAALLAQWPVANRQLRVPTRHGETFVIASGDAGAPPVVLLHGSAINSAMWMGDVADWSRHFHVLAVDIIGEPGFSAPSRPTVRSEAYVEWLDDLLAGLGLGRAAFVGISLGGWLALDYATHRPERVASLAVLAPGGVGRHRNVLLWALPLLLLGPWGRRQVARRIMGPGAPVAATPGARAFQEFAGLIFAHFRVRTEALPIFSDSDLAKLTMPLLAILGGKDAMIDSAGTRDRLRAHAARLEIQYLPEVGHALVGQTAVIAEFLRRTAT